MFPASSSGDVPADADELCDGAGRCLSFRKNSAAVVIFGLSVGDCRGLCSGDGGHDGLEEIDNGAVGGIGGRGGEEDCGLVTGGSGCVCVVGVPGLRSENRRFL